MRFAIEESEFSNVNHIDKWVFSHAWPRTSVSWVPYVAYPCILLLPPVGGLAGVWTSSSWAVVVPVAPHRAYETFDRGTTIRLTSVNVYVIGYHPSHPKRRVAYYIGYPQTVVQASIHLLSWRFLWHLMFDLFLLTLRTVHLESLGPKFWNMHSPSYFFSFSPTSPNGRRGTAYKPVLATKEPGWLHAHPWLYLGAKPSPTIVEQRETLYIWPYLWRKWKAKKRKPTKFKEPYTPNLWARKERIDCWGSDPGPHSTRACCHRTVQPVNGEIINSTKLQVRVLFNCDDDYCHPYRLHHNV